MFIAAINGNNMVVNRQLSTKLEQDIKGEATSYTTEKDKEKTEN